MSEPQSPKGIVIYNSVLLTIIAVLLAAVLGLLIYTGIKIKSEANTVSNKVNNFNAQVDKINTNLQNINTELQAGKGLPLP